MRTRSWLVPPDGATIGLQLWLAQSPWRPSAGWALLAALLASGQLTGQDSLPWQTITLLWILVDLLWGALWRFANGRSALLPLPDEPTLDHAGAGSAQQLDPLPLTQLPYMQPGSPAARLLGWDRADVWPWMMRVATPALLVSLLVAASLGKMALTLTAVVALCAMLGWTFRRNFARPPAFLQSVVLIGLPWLLTLWQLGIQPGHSRWRINLVLLSLWVLHGWGEGRIAAWRNQDWVGSILLWIADLCIIALLIYSQALLWLALLLAVSFPCWVALIAQQKAVQQKVGQQKREPQRIAVLRFCWLLSMLISVMAVR